MSNLRTLVINHTDIIGTPYTTRILTDFPPDLTDAYLTKAMTLYEELGMGVVSVMSVDEFHRQLDQPPAPGCLVAPVCRQLFGGEAVRGPRRFFKRPAAILGLVAVLLSLDLCLSIREELQLKAQERLIQSTAYHLGMPVPKPVEVDGNS